MVVHEHDGNGERRTYGAGRNPSRAKAHRSGRSNQPDGGAAGSIELDPERVHRDRGIRLPQRRRWPDVHEPADRSFGPFDGRPGGAGGDAPAGRIRSDVEHFQSRVRRPAPARTPPIRDRARACSGCSSGRLVDGGRAPRGLELGAQRRDDRARASRRAAGSSPRITSRAAVSRSSASRPVRCSSPGSSSRSSGSKRPAIAPSATACSVVTSVRSRCVSRSSRSAVSADTSAPQCLAAQRGLALHRAREQRPRRVRVRRRHLRQQPAGRFAAPRLDHPGRLRWNRFHVAPRHRAAADAHGRAPREIEAQLEAGHSDHRHGPVV